MKSDFNILRGDHLCEQLINNHDFIHTVLERNRRPGGEAE